MSAGSSLLDFIQKPQKTQKRELPFHKTALDAIIGSAGSLKNETAQVLAAISYPSGGLPVLLVGSAGVGKRKFAESLFLYSQETGRLRQRTPGSSSSTARITPTPRNG